MSEKPKVVYATITGFAGYKDGDIFLRRGEAWDLTDPYKLEIVKALRHLFQTEKPND